MSISVDDDSDTCDETTAFEYGTYITYEIADDDFTDETEKQ